MLQLSDVHVGRVVSDAYVLDVFARTAALGADIVALTGDIMSYHPDVFPQLRSIDRHLPLGELATVAILGNTTTDRTGRDPTSQRAWSTSSRRSAYS